MECNTRLKWINSFTVEVVIIQRQSIDLLSKSMDWFLYDKVLRHGRVNLFKPSVAFYIETNYSWHTTLCLNGSA